MSRAWIPRVGLSLFVIVIGYAIVSLSVGEGGPGSFDVKGVEEAQELLGGLRQDGARLGDPDASVQLDLYTDIRDTQSVAFQNDVVDPVIENYVRTNKAQINLHNFAFSGTDYTQPALAAIAAGIQGRQWQFANLVLANLDEAAKRPGQADSTFLSEIAEITPEMETAPWKTAFDAAVAAGPGSSDPVVTIAQDDAQQEATLKLPAQPAIDVTGPVGSEMLTQTPTLDEVEAAIAKVSGSS